MARMALQRVFVELCQYNTIYSYHYSCFGKIVSAGVPTVDVALFFAHLTFFALFVTFALLCYIDDLYYFYCWHLHQTIQMNLCLAKTNLVTDWTYYLSYWYCNFCYYYYYFSLMCCTVQADASMYCHHNTFTWPPHHNCYP